MRRSSRRTNFGHAVHRPPSTGSRRLLETWTPVRPDTGQHILGGRIAGVLGAQVSQVIVASIKPSAAISYLADNVRDQGLVMHQVVVLQVLGPAKDMPAFIARKATAFACVLVAVFSGICQPGVCDSFARDAYFRPVLSRNTSPQVRHW
jgi:hypothetical protein